MRFCRVAGARSVVAGVGLSLLVLGGAGCASTALYETTDRYYGEGPEKALEAIDRGEFRDADATLAALEKSVALLELGEYAESAALLDDCAAALDRSSRDPGAAVAGAVVNDEAGAYRAESFERVLVPTLALTDVLALQDLDAAGVEAEKALAIIDAIDCSACRFPFTRYLAAVTFEQLGDRERALATLAEAVAESPDLPFLQGELDRLAGDQPCPAADPEDGADSQAAGRRVLYVMLLLGRGPQKVQEAVPVPWSHAVAWPRYLPRLPEGVTGARLGVAGSPIHDSVLLSDVTVLAETSLQARLAGLIVREGVKTVLQEAVVENLGEHHGWGLELFGRTLFALADRADLRHWSTLPATCQVLRVTLADATACDLIYLTPDGQEVDRETLDLPAEWEDGALFVTRRMP